MSPIRSAARSRSGKRKDRDEAAFRILEAQGLCLLADGGGPLVGHRRASAIALDAVADLFARTPAADRLVDSVQLANRQLHTLIEEARKGKRAEAKSELDIPYLLDAPGTTIVAAQVQEGTIRVAHVGDSRAYRMRQGQLCQLTRDHSLLEDYRAARPGITDEDLRAFPHPNVLTRYLGMRDDVVVNSFEEPVQEGDAYLLCTRGLVTELEGARASDILRTHEDPEEAVDALMGLADGKPSAALVLLRC
jgi:protein phosphatase